MKMLLMMRKNEGLLLVVSSIYVGWSVASSTAAFLCCRPLDLLVQPPTEQALLVPSFQLRTLQELWCVCRGAWGVMMEHGRQVLKVR